MANRSACGCTGQLPVVISPLWVLLGQVLTLGTLWCIHHVPPQPYVPILTLPALLSCNQWPLMSVLAQAECNYQTGGTSRLINTLTSSSQPTRAYSTARRRSDNFIPHLSPGAHTHTHTRTGARVCVRAFVRVLPSIQQSPPLLHRGGE